MAILKCKMCGGDILLSEDKTTGTCDHCGSVMTFPRVLDEQKLNLYNRANHFRRQNEFDKAIAAYERILEQDDTDAEAHWGVVISRYGIEYVEDPATHERIPTCHRVQMTSILSDEDYLAAIEHAPDTASRDLYEQEARRIADIQKGILAISSQEKPYDVFICYKETDDSGSRTKDSALAQEIYYQLTNEGYKVFFSRITLEEKLGQQYEPYIFAALNSAKVMLVVGTKPEYFSTVWVKNEWSRYLALMKNDRGRLLIPCYRDMDPYDLPEELSALQSQDMSRIGFVQDLIRGVKKVLDAGKKPAPAPAALQPVAAATGANIENLMKRVRLFLEDGDFRSANEYLDKVLDEDAEYAPAYAGKVCTALGFRRESDLGEATFLYGDHPDWKKALRFAAPQQKETYEGYYEKVKERVADQIAVWAYDCAVEMAVNPNADRAALEKELNQYKASCATYGPDRADGSLRKGSKLNEEILLKAIKENEPGNIPEKNYKAAAEMFQVLDDADAASRAKECLGLAEQARQKLIYNQAISKCPQGMNAVQCDDLAKQFLLIPEYKDAKAQAENCQQKAESIRKKLYDAAIKTMREAGPSSTKWQEAQKSLWHADLNGYLDTDVLRKEAKQRYQECMEADQEAQRQAELLAQKRKAAASAKRKRIIGLCILFVVLAVAAVFVVVKIIIPKGHYDKGISLRNEQQWEEAVSEFEQAGSYSDAAAQILATRYAEGEAKREAQDWEGAIEAFTAAGIYSDAEEQILTTYYTMGESKRTTQKWEDAVTAFKQAGSYSDAATQILATYYMEGEAKRALQDWNGAITAFKSAEFYGDAATQIQETYYQQAEALKQADKYAEAYLVYTKITGYKDVDSIITTDENIIAGARSAKIAQFKIVGNFVVFGRFPKTSSGEDVTSIEWLVLDYDATNNRALLISRYGLDAQPYNEEYEDITWEKCTLRTWLNNTFYNKAFNTKEQSAILLSDVDNSSSQGYYGWSTDGGNITQDRIFLLSYAEANKYFGVTDLDSKNTETRIKPTSYALRNGAYVGPLYYGWWWLRSPGYHQDYAARVCDGSGALGYYIVTYESGCVRPAFWLNLDADIF